MRSFEKAVSNAVESYNHFRRPEAVAKLVKLEKDELVVDFEGSFCRTCGTYDYFEDLIYEVKRLVDVEMEITGFENSGPERVRVRYRFKAVRSTLMPMQNSSPSASSHIDRFQRSYSPTRDFAK